MLRRLNFEDMEAITVDYPGLANHTDAVFRPFKQGMDMTVNKISRLVSANKTIIALEAFMAAVIRIIHVSGWCMGHNNIE